MRADIELLRIISAFGIVWFHSGVVAGKEIAYSGLIFFIIVSVYFSLQSKKNTSFVDLSEKLLLPCAFWSLLYYIAYCSISSNSISFSGNILLNILSTPTTHLWFLPFIFIVTILLINFKSNMSKTVSVVFFSISLPTVFLSSNYWRAIDLPNPMPQYLHAVPAVIIGILFYALNNANSKLNQLMVVLSLLLSGLVLMFQALPGLSTTYLLGTLICTPLLLKISLFESEYIKKVSKLTFGIYLIHILPLALFNRLGIDNWLLPVLAFIVSAITIHLLDIFTPSRYKKLFIS